MLKITFEMVFSSFFLYVVYVGFRWTIEDLKRDLCK